MMTYFDNAATTYPKPEEVYSYMDAFYRESGGSAGRGHHALSLSAGALIGDTRKRLQELFHCPTKQVIFQPTATIALNIILQGVIQKGAYHVYISPFEHNAVTRVLHHFEEQGRIKVHILQVDKKLSYDRERIQYQFEADKPDLVVMSHASNTIGFIAPVESIFSLAKQYQAVTVLDMAQTAGLVDCNLGLDIFDFAVFAGHKTLYAPTGISGFVMKQEFDLPAVLFGGTGYDSANQAMPSSLPERFEMGTLNIAGVAGLNAALRWIAKTTVKEIREKEQSNREKLVSLLKEFDFITIVGNQPERDYIGVVSCLIQGISSDSASTIFSEQNIAVRTGLHCAPLAHQFLGTFPAGTIRFSVSYFTTEQDFDALRDALEYIEDNL